MHHASRRKVLWHNYQRTSRNTVQNNSITCFYSKLSNLSLDFPTLLIEDTGGNAVTQPLASPDQLFTHHFLNPALSILKRLQKPLVYSSSIFRESPSIFAVFALRIISSRLWSHSLTITLNLTGFSICAQWAPSMNWCVLNGCPWWREAKGVPSLWD